MNELIYSAADNFSADDHSVTDILRVLDTTLQADSARRSLEYTIQLKRSDREQSCAIVWRTLEKRHRQGFFH